jgi:putative transposase
MKGNYSNVPVATLCGLFGKSRQAWYDMQDRREQNLLQEELIVSWVREIRVTLPRIGGVKLLIMLAEQFEAHRIDMGRDTFFSILKKHDLLIQPKRRYVFTTHLFTIIKSGRIWCKEDILLKPNRSG